MIQCPKCKTENNDIAKFCQNCGRKLGHSSSGVFLKTVIAIILVLAIGFGAYYFNASKTLPSRADLMIKSTEKKSKEIEIIGIKEVFQEQFNEGNKLLREAKELYYAGKYTKVLKTAKRANEVIDKVKLGIRDFVDIEYGRLFVEGEEQIQSGNYEKALECFEKAMECRKGDIPSTGKIEHCKNNLYEMYFKKGQEYVPNLLWDEAINAYQIALKYKPDDKQAEDELKIVQAKKEEAYKIEEAKAKAIAAAEKKKYENMVYIPAGEFEMGSNDCVDEKPVHRVYLDGYYIDKYKVTNEQYAKFLNEWGKTIDRNGNEMIDIENSAISNEGEKFVIQSGYEKYPVIYISWYGANQYAKWCGKRLPTEAEWEKACSAGSKTKYCFGDDENKLGEYAWYKDNSDGRTHPVGKKKPNKWGLYDMHGNVWEWCSDWYDEKYYEKSPKDNPKGSNAGTSKVLRGGTWDFIANDCRSSYRGSGTLVSWGDLVGFRCVRVAK